MTAISRYRRLVNEAAMEQAIREAVAYRQGRVFSIPRSDLVPAMEDWPDLELILPDRGIVAHVELKSQRRIVTPGQREVIAMLQGCSRVESFIVRPTPRDESETGYDDFLSWLNGEKS